MATIDERLDRLTERHEALSQSVEILVREGERLQRLVESHEKRFEWLREDSIVLKERMQDMSEDIKLRELRVEAERRGRELDERIAKLVSAIARNFPDKAPE